MPEPKSVQAALFSSTYSVVGAAFIAVRTSRVPASRQADSNASLLRLRIKGSQINGGKS